MTTLYGEHAALYDRGYGPPSAEEIAWLSAQFGPGCRSVLEPGCGTGRMAEALAAAGYEVTGFDRSPAMVERAARRLARAGLHATLLEADMARFDLGRRYDAALCPIDTITHLDPAQAAAHLEAMATHLHPGAPYLVEVVLLERDDPAPTRWQTGHSGVEVSVVWTTEELDPGRQLAVERSRLEILTGPGAGTVVEERHRLTTWTPEQWAALCAASPLHLEGEVALGGRRWQRLVASRR